MPRQAEARRRAQIQQATCLIHLVLISPHLRIPSLSGLRVPAFFLPRLAPQDPPLDSATDHLPQHLETCRIDASRVLPPWCRAHLFLQSMRAQGYAPVPDSFYYPPLPLIFLSSLPTLRSSAVHLALRDKPFRCVPVLPPLIYFYRRAPLFTYHISRVYRALIQRNAKRLSARD
ncbi:hypothetical protein K438DRAFT_1976174 [Mycena galopus ATCC 62051]|nr:hypothetical protein K438DRAFT_1976174 [Mycena galopus ATCC 62051]